MALESVRDEVSHGGFQTRELQPQGRRVLRVLRRLVFLGRAAASFQDQLHAAADEWKAQQLRHGDLLALGQDAHNPLQPTSRRTRA